MKELYIKLIALVVTLVICFAVDAKLRGYSSEKKLEDGSRLISCIGKVISIDAGKATGEPQAWSYSVDGQIVTLRLTSGKYKGQEVFSANTFAGQYTDRVLKIGDILYVSVNLKSGDVVGAGAVSIGEFVRTSFLLYLAGIFTALVIIIGGMKGVKSIVSLALSTIFIVAVLVPMCLQGYSPVWIAILISAINTIITFILIGGVSKKAFAGILGTIGGLFITAILAFISSQVLHFTGQDINFGFLELGKRLWMSPESTNWNFSGILVAGMILGASGAVMDASMAVASAIEQVKKANPRLGVWNCIKAGMNVGKDEMGMMANTLIFAYIGADLTLILMPMVTFGEEGRAMPMTRVINEEATSSEVVQAIAGTIGIIMAIPLTAVIAGFLIGRSKQAESEVILHADHRESRFKHPAFRYMIPIALILISVGIHLVYSISRHSSESQADKSESAQVVSEYVRAKVIEKGKSIETPTSSPYGFGNAENEVLKAKLLGGAFRNEDVLVQNVLDPNRMPLSNVEVKPGDEVILKIDGTKDGIERVLMNNYSRDGYLIYLTGFLVIILTIVGRFQGIRTAFALGISVVIVIKVLVPLIVKGYNALVVVIVISGVIAFLSLIIVTGFNRKTGSATIGILGGVVVASFIIIYADQKLHFTGISSSRTAVLAQFTLSEKLDFRNILMAGIIMGLLGSAMDAAVVVASAVREIRRANPKLSTSQLITAGMSVGTDLLGTIVNTLVFAYLGLRLILLMTFTGTSILSGGKIEILSTEVISAEILRILAGSIGLVLTIPITAVVASLWDKIFGFLGLSRSS
jgi:uncharacterized membrane protein